MAKRQLNNTNKANEIDLWDYILLSQATELFAMRSLRQMTCYLDTHGENIRQIPAGRRRYVHVADLARTLLDHGKRNPDQGATLQPIDFNKDLVALKAELDDLEAGLGADVVKARQEVTALRVSLVKAKQKIDALQAELATANDKACRAQRDHTKAIQELIALKAKSKKRLGSCLD
jgi:hypothetical protein